MTFTHQSPLCFAAVDDFFEVSKSVTFGPNSATEGVCVQVELIDRPDVEKDERFSVRLSSQLENTAVILQPKEASILILDDDGQHNNTCLF